jgi:hypothetical protein
MRPQGPIADAGTDAARAPAFVGRKIGEIRTVPFAGVEDVKAALAHGGQHAPDRLDRRAGERQIVAHAVHIAADAAEIGLHVDDDERGVGRTQVAVVGPRIGVCLHVALVHAVASIGRPCAEHPLIEEFQSRIPEQSSRAVANSVPTAVDCAMARGAPDISAFVGVISAGAELAPEAGKGMQRMLITK